MQPQVLLRASSDTRGGCAYLGEAASVQANLGPSCGVDVRTWQAIGAEADALAPAWGSEAVRGLGERR